MKHESEHFIFDDDVKSEDIGVGIRRKILGYNDDLMVVKVWFDVGSIGYMHKHFHSQVTYVESGEFDVNVNSVIRRLKAGDSFYIPPSIDHGAECVKAGVLLDIFNPAREDFLNDK